MADYLRTVTDALLQPQSSAPAMAGVLGAPFNDQLSPSDRAALYQQMLNERGLSTIQTIDPGVSWGGMDRNAIQPADVMGDSALRPYRVDSI